MAEKSIRVKNDSSGDYVATIDATWQDGSGNNRVIQLVDKVHRKSDIHVSTPYRSFSGSGDLDSHSDLGNTGTQITAGDRDTLVVTLTAETISNPSDYPANAGFLLVPKVYTHNGDPFGFLSPKFTAPFMVDKTSGSFSSNALYTSANDDGEGNYSYSLIFPLLAWPIFGATKVSVFIIAVNNGFSQLDSMKMFADIVSGPAQLNDLGYEVQTQSGYRSL